MTINKQAFAIDSVDHATWPKLWLRGEEQTRHFHQVMGLTTRSAPQGWSETPSVSERILRGNLLMEEVKETLIAMGLTLQFKMPDGSGYELAEDDEWRIVHVEGSRYDPVETADGLADIKVIANGTAVAFGIPLEAVELEIFASNMSKLDEEGYPVVNHCTSCNGLNISCPEGCGRDPVTGELNQTDADGTSNLLDPTKPVGKLLKSSRYIPANIAGLFERMTGTRYVKGN